MNTVRVEKTRLLETLQRNRDEHRTIFTRAQAVYRDAMIAELDQALKEAREGKQIKRAFHLPLPEDHTEDFDTAIAMLDWEVDEEVELEQHEFQQYVENKWRWAASFAANTQSYVG